jgi:Metallo-peptidase family M12B Reprolysin-like
VRVTTLLCAGLGLVLAGPVVASAARAEDPALLDAPAHGEAALRRLGDDVDVAAARSGLELSALRKVLESDRTAWVDREGRLFYVEPARDADAAGAPATVAAALPYDQTFVLHSRPTATRVIYLDFDGYDVHDTAWNASGTPALTVPVYTKDGDPAFSTAELDVVQEVWARVAEDYAPFNIDVTTQDPGTAGLARSSTEDAAYGARAAISTDTSLRTTVAGCGGGCAGVAYVGTFDTVLASSQYQEYYQPAFVLPDAGYPAAFVAEIVSHEVGHNLGLSHDGLGSSPYYQDDGTKVWSPIMGAGYTPLTQFSNGDYIDATNTQDDFAVIAANGPTAVGDDYGDTTAVAFPLDAGAATATGLIGSRTDLDTFRVTRSCAGTLTATLAPAALGPGLDTRLRLLDAAGAPLAVSAPATARGGT